MSSRSITDDILREAIKAAELKVAHEHEKLLRLEEDNRGAERELALLIELARLRGIISHPAKNGDSAEHGSKETGSGLSSVSYEGSLPPRARSRDALVRDVIDVLREHGKPMPIRSLMAEVVSRGGSIPGRGEQANLISVITRVPEIIRPARGIYALSEWSLDDHLAKTQRATKARRRGSPR